MTEKLDQKYRTKVTSFLKEPTFPKIMRPPNYTLSLLDWRDVWAVRDIKTNESDKIH